MSLIDDIKDLLEEHLERQPYNTKCMRCGKVLVASGNIDKDMDLYVQVEPCECVKDE